MNKRLIASSVITLCTFACATPLITHAATPQKSIKETGRTVTINVQIGTKDSGIVEVTLVGPPTKQAAINDYSYALPMQNGRIAGTLINPWNGKTALGIMSGDKTVASATVTGLGMSLSEQQLDLLPSYLIDSNIPTVTEKANAIASTVNARGSARNEAVTSTTMQWVRTHIHTAHQVQTARADQTLASGDGNQASATALAIALLRANNIPAKAVENQTMRDGMYDTSYSVDVWIGGKWLNVGTP
ncbi:hypothetical protein Alches_25900 [Alicyclobacillus hesperidum subsp. aegles]|uniref:transglutaminase-like domain-containing protein n=1 Tax=Alicyclobacillus TaxID=29330 RepID=UPI00118F43F1|nr:MULTISPECIES: transglutaminase-like domain-containing protein [Alicyclobacillus]GEO27488.1 hypothetical protein AAC03nite_32730 [Alicyclobacillus acidoterrestris]GLG02549.1 hypothetical protein Alches_25900 [Alicyclobacillus hesperidum subsp. aegles]